VLDDLLISGRSAAIPAVTRGLAAGILAVATCSCITIKPQATVLAIFDNDPAACRYFAVRVDDTNYVIFKVAAAADLPPGGASVTSTTFKGFGTALVHLESYNADIKADIVYHADNMTAIADKLRSAHCLL
jgi:hypothetical protein